MISTTILWAASFIYIKKCLVFIRSFLYIEKNTLCLQDMKNLSLFAWLNMHEQWICQDELFMCTQPSLSDRFFISWKHKVLWGIINNFIGFSKEKKTEDKKMQERKKLRSYTQADRKSEHQINHMGLNAGKPVFRSLRTQVQTSLRIYAVWSVPLLFAD